MSPVEVAPNVFRLGNRTVNWWAIVTDEGITLVDAGLRRHMGQLDDLLRDIGRARSDVRAVVLTHADLDHIGIAEDLRRAGTTVFIHPIEADAAGGARRRPPKRALLDAWRPSMLVAAYEYGRDGIAKPRFVRDTQPLTEEQVLPIPGHPRVLAVPGHTRGSVALWLQEESIVFTGDALVTLDPFSGRRGPTLLAGYDNEDHSRAVESLATIADTDAKFVLPGHGEPWSEGAAEASRLARSG